MPGGRSGRPEVSPVSPELHAGSFILCFGGGPIGCIGPSLAFAEISFDCGESPGGSSAGGGSGGGGGGGEPSQIL